METLNSLFVRTATNKGSDTLFSDETGKCSGQEALRSVQAIAGGLSDLGISRGDRVAFLCDNSVPYVLSFFACQQMGIIPCALHVRSTVNDLARTLIWLNVSAVVVDSKYRKLAYEAMQSARLSKPLIDLGGDDKTLSYAGLIESKPAEAEAKQNFIDEPALIILSSGTTGAPKGVIHSQRTLYASALAGEKVFGGIESTDSTIIAMAPSFAAWNHVLFPFLAHQAKIVFIRAFNADLYINTINREKITHAALVPTAWRRVLGALSGDKGFSSLRCVFFSGEPATAEFISKMKTALPAINIRTAYLSSEGGDASACVADDHLLGSGNFSTGKAIEGSEIRIVDPDGDLGEELESGEAGEIVLRSRSLALGYWENAALTAERFVNGWWRSSDLGRMDKEGNLTISGRNDNLIISGGLKVHAEEVEAALMKHPAIDVAAVVGQTDEEWGQRIEAYVISNAETKQEEILNFCRNEALLASFKLPKYIHFCDKLPTGATGKLYRRGLLENQN